MITKETLKDIARKQTGMSSDSIIRRDLEINTNTSHAVIISGIRRCGKSILLHLLMNGYKHPNYFNFEDPRLEEFKVHDFEKLTLALQELNDSDVFFFDEIQNVPAWENYVRSLLDQKKKVFLTGSNASLLSKELGTKLTGRNLRYELFPFSFIEFCRFKKKEPSYKIFEEYAEEGGFPEYVKYKDEKILHDVYFDIIYRDVITRHKIKEENVLKQLTTFLISNVGKEFSYNSLRKLFSLGTANTPLNYISYLEDSYILFIIHKFDYSLKKQAVNPKKVYVIDNALANSVSSRFTIDKGRMLENLVFLELRKKHQNIYYFKNEGECDFVTQDRTEVSGVYQVCFEIHPDNVDRELDGLIEAVKQTKAKKYVLLTMNQEETFVKDGVTIPCLPVWKWMSINKK